MRLIYLALGWALGIWLERDNPALPSVMWVVAVVGLGVLVVLVWRRGWAWRWVGLTLLAVALGGYRMSWMPTTSDIARYNGSSVTIEGVVTHPPDRRDSGTQLRVMVDTVFDGVDTYVSDGLVLVKLPRLMDASYGERVRVTGRLFEPAVFDTFSYADYLWRFGIFSIMEDVRLEVVSGGHGSGFFEGIYALRQAAQEAIEHALPSPQSALLTGILLGNERGIDDALAEDFAVVGAAHIIAISGFNMALVAGLLTGFLGRVTERDGLVALAGVVVIALYTILVGAQAAVVRAAVMTSVLLIGQALKRRTFLPASLAFVVIVMSVVNPLVLWDVGFQLSFGAVLGIAVFTEPLRKLTQNFLAMVLDEKIRQRVLNVIEEPLIISIATLIPTLPLSMFYFQNFSPLVLVVNLLIVPVQASLLITGGLATFIAFVSPTIAQILYWMTMVLLSWTIGVVRWFAGLPYAEFALSVDGRLVGFAFLVLIGGVMLEATRPRWALYLGGWLRARWLTHTVLFTGGMVAILLWGVVMSRPDGRLHVWVLDVGHTNAILIQTPSGAQILIDGGQYPARLLTALGDRMPFYDRTLEVIAVTQADIFDTSALTAVLGRYDVGLLMSNGQPNLRVDEGELGEVLREAGVIHVRAGYTLDMGDGVLIEVLSPLEEPTLEDSMGDSVMVLRLSYGDMALLLTSEASPSLQERLLGGAIYPAANILQLPHNGTARSLSRDFVGVIAPQVGLLQVDSANRRGDPDDSVMAILEEMSDMEILRTDEQGTIHLWSDGRTLWIGRE